MAQYDLPFAAKLARVADDVDEKDPWAYDASRVTLYLSRLSMEIVLKAMLEKAGMPANRIRGRNHDLRRLAADLGDCDVEEEVVPGQKEWVSASRVRAVSVDLGFMQLPIGAVLDVEDNGGSTYPNEIRYGEIIIDFKPSLVSAAALMLAEWAQAHWNSIRYVPKNV